MHSLASLQDSGITFIRKKKKEKLVRNAVLFSLLLHSGMLHVVYVFCVLLLLVLRVAGCMSLHCMVQGWGYDNIDAKK